MNTGKEIFNNLQKDRDYKGSDKDVYAQDLRILFSSLGAKLFDLLESAQLKGQKLAIKKESLYNDEFTIEDVEFVNN